MSLRIENTGRFIKRLEVVEDIPKEIASHVNQVDFGVPPSEVIEADPVIKWALEDLDFYETRTIDYEVPVALNEYTPYVNWPLRQLNIFYTITRPREDVEISKAEASTLSPGESGTLSVTVSNKGAASVNTTLLVEPPTGWAVEPEKVIYVFAPSSKEVFNFTITPPEETTLGVYGATLRLSYQDTAVTKDLSLFVREPPAESPLMLWLLWLLLVALLAVIAYYGRRIYRGRKKKVMYREELVSAVHRLQDEIFKRE
ncbi:MAG: hypothetical protein D6733_02505 [Methanobacteriota archaeon]|nr:MAG: hypothetical protein D6733_02505 [Euryarchaeota archaeon]